jgi:hypothetical protein
LLGEHAGLQYGAQQRNRQDSTHGKSLTAKDGSSHPIVTDVASPERP